MSQGCSFYIGWDWVLLTFFQFCCRSTFRGEYFKVEDHLRLAPQARSAEGALCRRHKTPKAFSAEGAVPKAHKNDGNHSFLKLWVRGKYAVRKVNVRVSTIWNKTHKREVRLLKCSWNKSIHVSINHSYHHLRWLNCGNLADISKLWVSSGPNYPICNSKPKTLEGFQFSVTAKKCFDFHCIKHENKASFYESRLTWRPSSCCRSCAEAGWSLRRCLSKGKELHRNWIGLIYSIGGFSSTIYSALTRSEFDLSG